MPVDVVVVDPAASIDMKPSRKLSDSKLASTTSLVQQQVNHAPPPPPQEDENHVNNVSLRASIANITNASQADSLDGQQECATNEDTAVNIIRNLEDYLAAHNQLESGDEEEGMGDELISLENILPLPFEKYEEMSRELTESMSDSLMEGRGGFTHQDLELMGHDGQSRSGSNSSNLLHFDDVGTEKNFEITITDPFGPTISSPAETLFEQTGLANVAAAFPQPPRGINKGIPTKKSSAKSITKRGSSFSTTPNKSHSCTKTPLNKVTTARTPAASGTKESQSSTNTSGRTAQTKSPQKRASSAPRKSTPQPPKAAPVDKEPIVAAAEVVKLVDGDTGDREETQSQSQPVSTSDSITSLKCPEAYSSLQAVEGWQTGEMIDLQLHFSNANGHDGSNNSVTNNRDERRGSQTKSAINSKSAGARSGLIVKETVASRSRRRLENQRRQEEKAANTFYDNEYYTPLQRKEIEVKELRAQLLEAYQVVENRELELEVCHFEKDNQMRKTESQRQEAVSHLEQDIQALQHDIDLWRMRTITVDQKRQNVIGVIEKVKKEQEDKEKKHREMYLEMYQKGKNSILFERQVELEKLALESPEKVSKSELEAQLRKIDEEIQRWQQARLNEHYDEVKKPDTEAEAKLKFIRDPFFHYLVEQKRELSDAHLDTLVNMFQYSQVQMNAIHKSLENRRKHGKM